MSKFDYLIVGAGLFGSVFAYEATQRGKKCLVIDKRNHIAGNIYTENIEGINVHSFSRAITNISAAISLIQAVISRNSQKPMLTR